MRSRSLSKQVEAGVKYLFKQSAIAQLDSILAELATSSKGELPFKSRTVFQQVFQQVDMIECSLCKKWFYVLCVSPSTSVLGCSSLPWFCDNCH